MIANWHLNEWPTPTTEAQVFSGFVELSDGSVCAVLAPTLEAFNDTMATAVKALDGKLTGFTTL